MKLINTSINVDVVSIVALKFCCINISINIDAVSILASILTIVQLTAFNKIDACIDCFQDTRQTSKPKQPTSTIILHEKLLQVPNIQGKTW